MSGTPDAESAWIDSVADRFDRAMQNGERPKIEDYLGLAQGQRHSNLLKELLRIEIEVRIEQGELPTPEEYQIRFPADAGLIETLFRSTPIWKSPTPTSKESPALQIPGYKLLEKLGEGGMGVVYSAVHLITSQMVAVKIIKPGENSSILVARFQAELVALSRLEHANICRVSDAGTTDVGQLFFVMELIKGVSVTEYCDKYCLTPRERLEQFVQICKGVQYIHNQGIIHRDIKPSNVLVAICEGKPVPKIIDFGIAKDINRPLAERFPPTEAGSPLGTPEYMSPEQAELTPLGVDVSSDIYSLGVLLYELLTGTLPLKRTKPGLSGLLELLHRICHEDFPKPSIRLREPNVDLANILARRKIDARSFVNILGGELDWVVMKALEKDRTRRYETANEFAQDVDRFLKNEAVEARPPTKRYMMEKFAKKHILALTSFSFLCFVLIISTFLSTWFLIQAVNARNEARTARDSESQQKVKAQANEAQARIARREADTATRVADSRRLAILSRTEREKRLDRAILLAVEAQDKAGTPESRDSLYQSLIDHPKLRCFLDTNKLGYVSAYVTFSPDGHTLAVMYDDGELVLWNTLSQKRLTMEALGLEKSYIKSVVFSPDGHTLAGIAQVEDHGAYVALWDVETRIRVAREPLPSVEKQIVTSNVAFNPDGRKLAAGYEDERGGGVAIFDLATHTWLTTAALLDPKRGGHSTLVFSRDGSMLITGYSTPSNASVVFFNATTLTPLHEQPTRRVVTSLACSPDGKMLAAGHEGEVELFDVKKFTPLTGGSRQAEQFQRTLNRPYINERDMRAFNSSRVTSLAFRPDGGTLAAGYSNYRGGSPVSGGVILFTVEGQKLFYNELLNATWNAVMSVSYTPDGNTLAAGFYGGVALYDTGEARHRIWQELPAKPSLSGQGSVAYSPDGLVLALAEGQGVVFYDSINRTRLGETRVFDGGYQIRSMAYSPDGQALAVVFEDRVALLDTAKRSLLRSTRLDVGEGRISCVAFSRDFHTLAAAFWKGNQRGIVLFETERFTRVQDKEIDINEGNVTDMVFSPDGRTLAVGIDVRFNDSSGVLLFDTLTCARLRTDPLAVNNHATISALAYSPDGRALTVGYHYHVVFFDTANYMLINNKLFAPGTGINCFAYSRDGHTLAVGYNGGNNGGIGGIALYDMIRYRPLQKDPLFFCPAPSSTVWFIDSP